ncbi:hypothetical protein Q5P01_015833 [Channa striata]|uniref:Uncharacterized protein n=1 Tax=Channa striata TaxID=64152 RepID=A0AA88MCC3_CHASR|nr:hypothetical protein Q5P01_015833 [Channa striata]
MPVLASAIESVEEVKEEEVKEISSKKDPSDIEVVEQTLNPDDSYTTLKKTSLSPGFVLPPLPQPTPAPECCDHQKTRVCFTPLPPISLFEQTTTVSSNCTTTGCRGEGDGRPWIDDILFSKTRSAEFHLPDITLSSLDALLQTVTQKLGKKRRGFDEGPWRRVQLDHLLITVNEQPLSEKMVDHNTEERNKDNTYVCGAATETSVCRRSLSRQTRLPPLFSAPKPTLILTMTKKAF